MKYYIIFNPGSKHGQNKKILFKIKNAFTEKKLDFKIEVTGKLEDAYNFSLKANLEKYDVIIAAGGDGTINNVLNGFFNENGKLISNALMGVIYTGTSPDFCKSYKIPLKFDDAIKNIFSLKFKNISIGQAVYSNINNYDKYIFFGCCMNIGIGADIAKFANSGIRKYFGDAAGTFISIIKSILNFKPSSYQILCDDIQISENNIFNISIGRTEYIASGIKVKNELQFDDNKFYILSVRNIKLSNFIKIMYSLYSGKNITNDELLNLKYCSKLELKCAEKKIEIECDGDPLKGYLPCRIQTAADKLKLIC